MSNKRNNDSENDGDHLPKVNDYLFSKLIAK